MMSRPGNIITLRKYLGKVAPAAILLAVIWLAVVGCKFTPPSDPSKEILEAAAQGNLAEIEKLLNQGADVNTHDTNGITPLMLASAEGYREIVVLLLEKGADAAIVNNHGETALSVASEETIRMLLRQQNSPRQNISIDDLCYAARMGDLDAVKNQIKGGISINSRGRERITALIEASLEGRLEIVTFLLEKGAEVDAQTDYGATALMAASREGHLEIVQALLQKGARSNIKNRYGEDARALADQKGYKAISRLLAEQSAAKEEIQAGKK